MIEPYRSILQVVRALRASPRRRRRAAWRKRGAGRATAATRLSEIQRGLRRGFARGAFVAVSALLVAVAAPFTALAFVDETEAPTSIQFTLAQAADARSRYVDDVVAISVADSTPRGAFRELSDAGPEISPPLPEAAGGGFSAIEPREPSVPEPGFGTLRQSTPTPTPPPAPLRSEEEEAPAPPREPFDLNPPVRDAIGRIERVNLTFYSCLGEGFCGTMANGELVHEGAVACSFDLPLGTVLRIVGDPTDRYYVCKDRGLLTPTWIDVYWYDDADGWVWQAAVGRHGTIEIISLP